MGAAGGLEAIATIKAIQTGWLHIPLLINLYVISKHLHFSRQLVVYVCVGWVYIIL